MTACMGGWCDSRERCAAYHALHRQHPADRLCPAGAEYPRPFDGAPMTLQQLIEEATA